MLWKCCTLETSLENSAGPQDWKRSVFIPVPKKGNAKECSNYHTIPLISHGCKVVFKALQARLQHYVNWELPDVQTGFINGRGTRDQIANICGSSKKQENIRKTSTTALLIMPKPLTLWITTNCGKLFKRWDYQTTLTCLLRNLYAGQEATVRTGHGTTDLFQIGKGICQGCILSPCLFNLYAEYSKQAGIKIAGRNINNLRYTDDTTLVAESKEALKSLLMKMKEESEKAGLKFNIQKTKIMRASPITSWWI